VGAGSSMGGGSVGVGLGWQAARISEATINRANTMYIGLRMVVSSFVGQRTCLKLMYEFYIT